MDAVPEEVASRSPGTRLGMQSGATAQEQWDAFWRAGRTRWDLGRGHWLHSRLDPLLPTAAALGRATANVLVPGAGHARDAIELCMRVPGSWVVAADISPTAVKAAQEVVAKVAADRPEFALQLTSQLVVQAGDFFKLHLASAPAAASGRKLPAMYDLVYDYTFLCALPPTVRSAWADQMGRLVRRSTLSRAAVCALAARLAKSSTPAAWLAADSAAPGSGSPLAELQAVPQLAVCVFPCAPGTQDRSAELLPHGPQDGPPFAMSVRLVSDLLTVRGWELLWRAAVPERLSHPKRAGREHIAVYVRPTDAEL